MGDPVPTHEHYSGFMADSRRAGRTGRLFASLGAEEPSIWLIAARCRRPQPQRPGTDAVPSAVRDWMAQRTVGAAAGAAQSRRRTHCSDQHHL